MENTKLRKKTPIMGWASWNYFRTNISESIMKEQADALIATGLAEYGYTYLNMDDGFFGGRTEEGVIKTHPERFPNGIKEIADYAHSLGLKAGTYAEGGDNTCGFYYDNEGYNGSNVGLYGYEELDLRLYLQTYDFDFIKVDWCGGLRLGLSEEEQYTKIGRIIEMIRQESNKEIVYNICRWQFPGAWAVEIADSWRTGADIEPTFSSILHQIDNCKPLAKYCGPGHVNDLDIMQIGNGLSQEEEKTHFSMWCMMSTPLMIGCDLTKISKYSLDILKNSEMIAINQDSACQQAFVTKQIWRDACGKKGIHLSTSSQELLGEVWIKNLEKIKSSKKAVAFLNRSNRSLRITVSQKELGLGGSILSIRDVWQHKDLDVEESFDVSIPAHGVIVYLVIAEFYDSEIRLCEEESFNSNCQSMEWLTEEEVKEKMKNGAVIVDVRESKEYEISHYENAINIPYTDIHGQALEYLPYKEQPIVVYCKTGKRCSQAKQSLLHLGYNNVYEWKLD